MASPKIIEDLVERFGRELTSYKSSHYKEAQLRQEFIDPFFECLGWDMSNQSGNAEAYKDVIHEDSLKIQGKNKAPDYCFRIGGTRKFFVEAKKPFIDIRTAWEPAYQLRRYAWSAKLPLSILTDFEGLAVYDCARKPSLNDKPKTACIEFYNYEDFPKKWDVISSYFSRPSILKGAFDRFANSAKGKRGTDPVDKDFLNEIEKWREALAKNIAARNHGLSESELNFAVQMTIDRIVFLRICEDRGIEDYRQLDEVRKGANTYEKLGQLFHQADQKYNSGLFHFVNEKGRREPDGFTLQLRIDDKVLKEILQGMYYPECPYEFSVLSADILGQAYERFLGKVIRVNGNRASVELKPEVKKSGGVFYTPSYIVESIVSVALGGKLEGLSAKQASRIKVLDPACGSGSFLIEAYNFLLRWHLERYIGDGPETHRKELTRSKEGEWVLTTKERKRILTNNIYGVDIDFQAVEVTKLSLLLKVLEGETQESINSQLKLLKERALPDLSDNIKCGNSLIDSKFYESKTKEITRESDFSRINIFDWEKSFPTAMSNQEPGFDVIIGNPPYIRIQALQEWASLEVEYYKGIYAAAINGNYDLYVVFVERCVGLLNSKGRLGFILPHKFFNAQYGAPLREFLAHKRIVSEIVHFGENQIFDGATTYTCLLYLERQGVEKIRISRVKDLLQWRTGSPPKAIEINSNQLSSKDWNLESKTDRELLERLGRMPIKLETAADRIFQGLKTSADKIYIFEEVTRTKDKTKVFCRELGREYWLESSLLFPLVKSGDGKRFHFKSPSRLILFPYQKNSASKMGLISEALLGEKYPFTWKYLKENKAYLAGREDGKFRGKNWYAFGRNQALDVIQLPKIFTPDLAQRPSFSHDEKGEYFFTGGAAGGYGLLLKSGFEVPYMLGVLNSSLMEWFIRRTSTPMKGGYFSFESRFIKGFPVVKPENQKEHRLAEKISLNAESVVEHKKTMAKLKSPSDKERLESRIHSLETAIDEHVFALYNISADEELNISLDLDRHRN